jgi:hypothetical protein
MQGDTESTSSSDSEGLRELFMEIVSDLADGELTFPPPFDLAASAALACNIDVGAIAVKLFNATRQRDCGYQVSIQAISPDDESVAREIVNTTVPSTRLLLALLDGLMEELHDRRTADRTEP